MKVSRQQTPPSQSPPSRKDIYFFRKWGEETAGGGASPEASERRQRSIPTRIMIACPNAAPSPALQTPFPQTSSNQQPPSELRTLESNPA